MQSNTIYGYARVSTKEQNIDRQLVVLFEFPVEAKNIFTDKAGGKDFDRPGFTKLMRRLQEGDVLVIKSIDRLGRNYEDIMEQWRLVTKERHADVVVMDMPLLDTRKGPDDLTGAFIADMVLKVLSYVAQIEQENIHTRQAEGIAAAKARGVAFGRPAIERPGTYADIVSAYRAGAFSQKEAAARLEISPRTLRRWLAEGG